MGSRHGPHIKPQIVIDDRGSYTVWPGMKCSTPECRRELTSRCRYGHTSMCNDCGTASRRAADKARKGSTTTRTRAPRTDEVAMPSVFGTLSSPLKDALAYWLLWPFSDVARERLHRAIRDHELRARLVQAMPESDKDEACREEPLYIPVEEVIFDNPEHRTTRLEFLADCEHYGV